MHPAAYDYVGRYATREPIQVVEVGSRDVNYSIRPLFPNARYWGIDAQDGPMVDEVADGAVWQPPEPVDLVVCAEVFEHTPSWRDIAANIYRMLRPGGRAVFTMAGPGRPAHGLNVDDPLHPGWYRNIETVELEEALDAAGFVGVQVEQLGDDVRGTGCAPDPSRAVVTCLFNRHPDPQSGRTWPADLGQLTVLDTVRAGGHHAVVINDCLDLTDTPDVTFVRVDNDIPNAYWARWTHIAEWLKGCGLEKVWCVDGGDVRLLHDPFTHLWPGVLYLGSEPPVGAPNARSVGFWWMRGHHPDRGDWIEANADRDLLNPGLVGGHAATVWEFAETLAACWPTADRTDMAAANELAYSAGWLGRFVTGDRVHTPMWSHTSNDHSWWAHK